MFELSRRRRTLDIWPGYVDAMSSLLLVVIFVILFFTLGHYSLSEMLRGRELVLQRLNVQVAELARLLSVEEAHSTDLRRQLGELTTSLERATSERARLATELGGVRTEVATARGERDTSRAQAAGLEADLAALRARRDTLEQQVVERDQALETGRAAIAAQQAQTVQAEEQVALLNRQLTALREQLQAVAAALELSQKKVGEQDTKIADLGQRLNVALASKVQELARYRSEFFGRLRDALGNHPDIRIVGDRFVFQSELFFDTASAELGPAGREQVRRLVGILKQVTPKIPSDIDWVLQVDGHTDRRPIRKEPFPSNWELSTARALAIVKYAIELGIPPRHLAANGFAEFHPLDPGDGEAAWARNRRIEVKLTSR